MGSIFVSNDFSTFCNNLRLNNTAVSNIQTRYHEITKRINQDFWNTDSYTTHSLYVGSYDRGTCIYTSDVDIVVELPWSYYTKYNDYSENGQSALLQAARNSLMKTYSSSVVSTDGIGNRNCSSRYDNRIKTNSVKTFLKTVFRRIGKRPFGKN